MLQTEYIPRTSMTWEARGSDLSPFLIQPPESESADEAWQPPGEMRLALIAGVHPLVHKKHWVLVARGGGSTLIPLEARLHPFTKAGMDAAFDAANQLRPDYDDGWTGFVSRALVIGPWNDPDEVTPVWIVERLEEPVPVMYYFR